MQYTNAEAIYQRRVGFGANAIEAIAVTLIVSYILIATLTWLIRSLLQRRFTLDRISRPSNIERPRTARKVLYRCAGAEANE